MKRIALVAGVLLLLAGCQTAQQQPPRPTAADDPSARCFDGLLTDARFTRLYEKSPRKVAEMSLEATADASRATDDEKRLLGVYVVARQTCHESGEQFRRTYAPAGWPEAITRFQGRYLDLIADLYSGTSTWGEFNRRRRSLSGEVQAQLSEITNRDNAERGRQAEAQRQNALNNYLLYRSLQPTVVAPLPAPRRPVNCTTRYIGNTAYTSCD